jgi:hypothetical protein
MCTRSACSPEAADRRHPGCNNSSPGRLRNLRYLRRTRARLDVRADLFDFCLLFLQPFIYRRKRCFQVPYSVLLLDKRFVFFQEFIQQHRVDRAVPNGFDLPIPITDSKIGINLRYVLGDQPVLEALAIIDLLVVTEGDRFKLDKVPCWSFPLT